jgi:hypothetical protein
MPAHCPAHVTLRVRHGVPSLRTRRFIREFQHSLRAACERPRVPCVPVLNPARSPAHDRGGQRKGGAGPRDEGGRGSIRASRESGLPAERLRALRAISPANPRNAARGSKRPRVRPLERAQALAPAKRNRSACGSGCGVLRRLVRRMEATAARGRSHWFSVGRASAQLAVEEGMAPPRSRGSGGSARAATSECWRFEGLNGLALLRVTRRLFPQSQNARAALGFRRMRSSLDSRPRIALRTTDDARLTRIPNHHGCAIGSE